jgi:N-acyl-D-amino-acid deacylase
LDSIKLSINVATLIGHNDVRKAILGEAAVTPNADQLKRMQDIVEQGHARWRGGFFYRVDLHTRTVL